MRILAIRGCNLASLAGEFEIDLSRAPFSDAGVFAIVGNTGAGKSTLLDALCVALFDRTPRLTNHSRVVVGRGEDDPGALGAQDVRTLLRRGAAAGYAEVDFEAGDTRRYRARWSVRRARNQTDGTLQDQQITLTAIDGGERFGGTKTETLRAITSRLGLTFDQFRRSALLAQGEFAAFLRADGRDRSELLERMTGTEIYSRLSIAAHVKAALAEQALRDGHARAEAIPVLADEARAAAARDLALAQEAKLAAREALAAVEALARWRAEARRLSEALAAAEGDHVAAVASLAAADPERAELALRRRAEQLRGVWEAHARADRAVALAQSEVTAAEMAVAAARSTYEALVARRASLAALHEPVRAARIAAGMAERTSQGPAASITSPLDVPDIRSAGDAARAFELSIFQGGAVEDALQIAAGDAGWLVAHAALAPEVAAWPELDTRFAQHGTLADAIASIERTVRDHTVTRNKLVKAREVVAAEHAAAGAKLVEAQRKAASHLQRRGVTLEVARRQEDEARTRLVEVERLVSIAASARDALHVRQNIDQQLAELDEQATVDTDHRTRILADRAAALVTRSERARIVEELRRAAGYEHARAELVDGEPCPLCGAEDHPWKSRGAFDDVIRAEETRLAEVTAQLELAGNALAQLAAREQQRAKDRQRLTRSRETAVASAATDVPRWREQLTSLGELLLETDPSSTEAERIANELEAAATARLEHARTVFGQVQAAAKAAQEAQAEVQLAQANADQIQLQLADHDRRLAELDATVQRLSGERTSRTERAAELDSELSAAMARWRAALDDPMTDRGRSEDSPRTTRSNRRRVGTGVHEADLRAAIMRAADAPLSVVDPRDLVAARGAMSEVAAAWRTRADRVSAADAAATNAVAAVERATRDAERAVTEHAARHEAALHRRTALVDELREASERLADALAGTSEPIVIDDPAGRRAADRDDEAHRDRAAAEARAGRTAADRDDEARAGRTAADRDDEARAGRTAAEREEARGNGVAGHGADGDDEAREDRAAAVIGDVDFEPLVIDDPAGRRAADRGESLRAAFASRRDREVRGRAGDQAADEYRRIQVAAKPARDGTQVARGEHAGAADGAADEAADEYRRIQVAAKPARDGTQVARDEYAGAADGAADEAAGEYRRIQVAAKPARDGTQVARDEHAGAADGAADEAADEYRRIQVAAKPVHDGSQVARSERVEPGPEAVRGELDIDNLRRLLAASPARIDELAALMETRERAVERTRAIVAERRARCDAHAAAHPVDIGRDAVDDSVLEQRCDTGCDVVDDSVREQRFDIGRDVVDDSVLEQRFDIGRDAVDDSVLEQRSRELAAQVRDIEQRAAQLAATIAADDDARARREAAMGLVAEAERAAEMDRVLGEVIGSHDGKLFRSFAQSLTLDGLLAVANAHLEELAPRYQLERVPRHDLELQVIDRDLGAEVRSVQSLSGGESFLVSLALALGLSSMSAHDVRVRTLLIDEGFGTLDPATLDSALSVLDALQATGRQVGVISHVPALVERVGAHVRVIQRGGGRSEVIVA